MRVHEDEVWCEYCWDARDTIWLDGDNGDSGGDYLMYSDLEKFVPPEQQRISELEAQVSAWQRWYDHWEFSNDYNLPDSPETEDQMK